MECFETVVPELRDLRQSYDDMSSYQRGKAVGYIIGKYGVDILIPIVAIKGISKYRALKRANSMYSIESCSESLIKKTRIMEASNRHVIAREAAVQAAKTGRIVPHSANVVPHVMQPKHRWGKLLQITGRDAEDFAKVVKLLEEEKILSSKYLELSRPIQEGAIIRLDHVKVIKGHEVKAVFNYYVETGQTYLKDAWVITIE